MALPVFRFFLNSQMQFGKAEPNDERYAVSGQPPSSRVASALLGNLNLHDLPWSNRLSIAYPLAPTSCSLLSESMHCIGQPQTQVTAYLQSKSFTRQHAQLHDKTQRPAPRDANREPPPASSHL
jgi:hypothetical protein